MEHQPQEVILRSEPNEPGTKQRTCGEVEGTFRLGGEEGTSLVLTQLLGPARQIVAGERQMSRDRHALHGLSVRGREGRSDRLMSRDERAQRLLERPLIDRPTQPQRPSLVVDGATRIELV